MSPLQIHTAILDCDTPVPNVYAERGLYSDVFATLLQDAATKTSSLPELNLQFSSYDCVRGQLPSEEDLLQIDVVIITGSAASAYDDAPWIKSLAEFTRKLYFSYPNIKLFGSCFGHQLICDALFSLPGEPVVHRDPQGWELGVHPITLTPAFISHFGAVSSNPTAPSQMRLQFVHADHVVLHSLPAGFHVVGSSQHCVLQGIWRKGRVLTYQGHAEFDRFINGETLKAFGKPIWDEGFLGKALDAVERDDDAIWAAGVMLRFFLEDGAEDVSGIIEEEVNIGGDSEVMARL